MNIAENVNLANYSTMGLGGNADYLTIVESNMELLEALSWAQKRKIPIIMIGGGSNIIWKDEGFNGLIIVNQIQRYETFKEDDLNVYVTAGAGENWDTVVERTAQAGLTGIEALSLIPGTAGATPVQNVGAYGQEIAQTLTTIEAFDIEQGDFINIRASDCGFGYRTSRFKTNDRGRFFITAITMHLTKANPSGPFYASAKKYLDDNSVTEITPIALRKAVLSVRNSRLPDPKEVKNNGSFFANPIIKSEDLVRIRAGFPEIPSWTLENGDAKLSAAWLLEQAGFKEFYDASTGMATWPAQPLVIINEKAKTTADLLNFKKLLVDTVHEKFGVTLVQEPELLPVS